MTETLLIASATRRGRNIEIPLHLPVTEWKSLIVSKDTRKSFRPEITFLDKFGLKNKNCEFKPKHGIWINSNMQNSVVVFSFSVLDRKNPFWANLVQKIKIVSLSWNLVPRLIRILEFNGELHCFCFLLETPVLGKFGPKIQNCLFKLKLVI